MADVVGFMEALLEYRRLMLVAIRYRVFFARKPLVIMKPTTFTVIQPTIFHETSNVLYAPTYSHHETSNNSLRVVMRGYEPDASSEMMYVIVGGECCWFHGSIAGIPVTGNGARLYRLFFARSAVMP